VESKWSDEVLAMARQLHSAPAAAAMTLVICVATVGFMILVLLPGVSLPTHHAFAVPVNTHIRNITRAAGIVMILGYLSGLVGWIVTLALRRDGMHRLASVRSVRQQY
jgi:hypothetical protein